MGLEKKAFNTLANHCSVGHLRDLFANNYLRSVFVKLASLCLHFAYLIAKGVV